MASSITGTGTEGDSNSRQCGSMEMKPPNAQEIGLMDEMEQLKLADGHDTGTNSHVWWASKLHDGLYPIVYLGKLFTGRFIPSEA